MADPDLQISGRGGGHPDPEIRGGGGGVLKKFFPALRASVWSKNKGEAAPLGPSLGSATAMPPTGTIRLCLHYTGRYEKLSFQL